MNEQMTVSVKEASELLGVGLQSTYLAVRRGALPALRVGRKPRLRIPRLVIERLLEDPALWEAGCEQESPASHEAAAASEALTASRFARSHERR